MFEEGEVNDCELELSNHICLLTTSQTSVKCLKVTVGPFAYSLSRAVLGSILRNPDYYSYYLLRHSVWLFPSLKNLAVSSFKWLCKCSVLGQKA